MGHKPGKEYKGLRMFNDNPILNKDPLGDVGEPIVKDGQLIVYSDVYFYGGAATGKLASTAANNMQSEWTAAQGTVTFQGKEYHNVQYKVTAHVVSEQKAQQMAAANQGEGYDPRMNFARIESRCEVGLKPNRVTGENAGGDNSMYLLSEDIHEGNTSQSHEMGHGFGMMYHAAEYQRLHGQPSIMSTIHSYVDGRYSQNGQDGGILNDDCRQVTQEDVNGMNINNYKGGLGSGNRVGASSNVLFDKNGNTVGGKGTEVTTPAPQSAPKESDSH